MSIETNRSVEQTPLRGRLRQRGHARDVLTVLSVPAVLGLVYLFPYGVRESFVFDYTDPTLLTAFVSTFVHLDAAHLFANVGMYAAVVPLAYVLSVVSGNRRRFYTVFVSVLLAFPFVLSYLNLAVARPAVAFGASGVVMAFVGYLPMTLADYLDAHFDVGPPDQVAPMLFLFGLGVVSVLSLRAGAPADRIELAGTVVATLVAVACAVWYAFAAFGRDRGRDVRATLGRAVDRSGYFELAVAAVVLCLGTPVVAFPADASAGTGVFNLYVHLLGYTLGFVSVFATVATTDRLGRRPI